MTWQTRSNLVHFSFKLWHLVATALIKLYRNCTNQRNRNQNERCFSFSRSWPWACFLTGRNAAASVAPTGLRARQYAIQQGRRHAAAMRAVAIITVAIAVGQRLANLRRTLIWSMHMNNSVEKRFFFKFLEVKWLHLTGEVDKSVRYSRQLFSRFNIPKIIKVGFNRVIQKIKNWTLFSGTHYCVVAD